MEDNVAGMLCLKGRPAEENIDPTTTKNNPSAATGATGVSALKECDTSKEVRDSISGSKIVPPEQLFNNLQPTIKDICETLTERKEFQIRRRIEMVLQATSLTEDDNVSELFDKDITNVILQLDFESKEEEKMSSLAIDLKRVLADLPTQNTNLSCVTDNESKDDKKLKPADLLEKLWSNPFFQDKLKANLDLEYKADIHNHRHLAEEFDIPQEDRDLFISKLQQYSPSEKLFAYLQATQPQLTIKDLCENLKKGKAYAASKYLQIAASEGKFTESDFVFEILDNDLDLKTSIIIQLDFNDLWNKVADQFNIPEKKRLAFAIDPECNPAGNFFDVLRTQSPGLKISKLKGHLRDLDNNMLEEMKDIPDERPLSELSSHAALMCDVILPKLNAPGNNLLYKLAEKFQKDGYLKEVDIDTFIVSQNYESPTVKMMEYVLRCQPIQYKIQDLVDRLEKIGRVDCCIIISKYVKGLQKYQEVGQDVDTVK